MSYARISSRRIAGGIVVALALFAVGAAVVSSHSVPRPAGRSSSGRALTQVSGVARQSIVRAYAKLPLVFVPNAGQASKSVRYYAQGPNFSFYFARSKAVLVLAKGHRRQVLDLRFLGANPHTTLLTSKRQPGTVNYLTSGERHSNLPTYGQLVYRNLWPGVDLAFSGARGRLEYEFRVRPGADPSQIRLSYAGARRLSLGAGGALVAHTQLGSVNDAAPRSFQTIGGRRVGVESRYSLADGSYGFALGHHDPRKLLVIDPSLAYSTFVGGSGEDEAAVPDLNMGIAVDSTGAAYIAGMTESTDFPVTPGAFETTHNAITLGDDDVFVTKLNRAGSALVYSTYLGGSSDDFVQALAVDGSGAAYVTGNTDSSDFPTTAGAFDTTSTHPVGFVTKVSPTGSSLAYSTLLGGSSGFDQPFAVAVDSTGAAYLTGRTGSADFPTTAGAFDPSYPGGQESAFISKLNAAGSALVYSTFLGGSSNTNDGNRIAIDSSGAAYVSGVTASTDFPTTPGAFNTSYNGGNVDAFVTKLNPAGSSLVYSTYLGGSQDDDANGIAIDSTGAAYATGATGSANFPTTPGAFRTSYNGVTDGYVTKLNPSGSGLVYSTYLGGSGFEDLFGIAVDSSGAAFVTGSTESTDYPTTPDAFQNSLSGGNPDVALTKLNATGSGLIFSTYLGGSNPDQGSFLALDAVGAAYIVGFTGSSNFPTTSGAFDTTYNGNADAFVSKLSFGPGPPATLALAPKTATNVVGTQHCVTATVQDVLSNSAPDITVRFAVTGSVNTIGSQKTDANGQATFCYQGPQLPGTDAISAFADTDNNGGQGPGEPADTAAKTWAFPTSSCTAKLVAAAGEIVAADGDHAVFAGLVVPNGATPRGEEQYLDLGRPPRPHLDSVQIQALTCNAARTQATIFGTAKVDGAGAHKFRIDVQDLGEPGIRRDTYRILIDTGYDSGVKTLTHGNIHIH
jgi:hypothetical protein